MRTDAQWAAAQEAEEKRLEEEALRDVMLVRCATAGWNRLVQGLLAQAGLEGANSLRRMLLWSTPRPAKRALGWRLSREIAGEKRSQSSSPARPASFNEADDKALQSLLQEPAAAGSCVADAWRSGSGYDDKTLEDLLRKPVAPAAHPHIEAALDDASLQHLLEPRGAAVEAYEDAVRLRHLVAESPRPLAWRPGGPPASAHGEAPGPVNVKANAMPTKPAALVAACDDEVLRSLMAATTCHGGAATSSIQRDRQRLLAQQPVFGSGGGAAADRPRIGDPCRGDSRINEQPGFGAGGGYSAAPAVGRAPGGGYSTDAVIARAPGVQTGPRGHSACAVSGRSSPGRGERRVRFAPTFDDGGGASFVPQKQPYTGGHAAARVQTSPVEPPVQIIDELMFAT